MEDELNSSPEPKSRWFEPALVLLMAVASVATAWCSYQSSAWSQQNNDLETNATKLERQAVAQHLEARQIEAMQTRLWMELMDAQLDGDDKLARFYTDRLTDELKPAYDKWIALKPLENPAAPPNPFAPGLYTPRFEKEIRDAQAESLRLETLANAAEHYASSYLGGTVTLAIVLFFAGTAEKFSQRRVRRASLAFAIVLFATAVVRMVMLPVA